MHHKYGQPAWAYKTPEIKSDPEGNMYISKYNAIQSLPKIRVVPILYDLCDQTLNAVIRQGWLCGHHM